MEVAIVGSSQGNGHPFSFGALLNGYEPGTISAAGWTNIESYLERNPEFVGQLPCRVSYVRMATPADSVVLAAAIRSKPFLRPLNALVGLVDCVLVLRDDWPVNSQLGLELLQRNQKVFIDKPLTLDNKELVSFRPFLVSAHCMSASALRYWRNETLSNALLRGDELVWCIPSKWAQYGVHILEFLDAQYQDLEGYKMCVTRKPHDRIRLTPDNPMKSPVTINLIPGFQQITVRVLGPKISNEIVFDSHSQVFHELLKSVIDMCATGVPTLEPESTVRVLQALLRYDPSGEHRSL